MKIAVNEPNRLVLADHPWFWSALCCLFVVTTLASTYQMYVEGELSVFKAVALGLATVGCIAGAIVFSERTRIDVWAAQQRIDINRTSFTGQKNHSLAFADVDKIVLESRPSQHSQTSRIVIYAKGEAFPLTTAYSGKSDQSMEVLTRLRAIVIPDATDSPEEILEDSLRAMIADGRTLQATAHLAEARQWKTTRARQYVEQLKRQIDETSVD